MGVFTDTSDFPVLGGGSSYASQAQHSGMFSTQPQGQLPGGIPPPGPPPGLSAPGTAGGQGQSNGLRDDSSRGGDDFPALGNMAGNGAVAGEGKDRVSHSFRIRRVCADALDTKFPSQSRTTRSSTAFTSFNITQRCIRLTFFDRPIE
jgi:hypothetical protein